MFENLPVRDSKIPDININNNTKSVKISPESQLKDEVRQAKKGARSFFFHPATIAIFSILTLGLYGIGVGIHALATKESEIDKLDAKSTEIPAIRSKKDLIKYLIKCCEDGHTVNGKSEEEGEAQDKEGKKAKLFTFKGIVFRGDRRPPKDIKGKGGFKSKNDLSDPKNM